MITIDDTNYLDFLLNNKRIVWFFFREDMKKTSGLQLRPLQSQDGESVINELIEEFPNVVFAETYIESSPKILEYFGLNDNLIWDYKKLIYNPRVLTVKDGYTLFDQAGKKCYCLDTLVEMIFELHPELVGVPSSE